MLTQKPSNDHLLVLQRRKCNEEDVKMKRKFGKSFLSSNIKQILPFNFSQSVIIICQRTGKNRLYA